MDIAIVGLGCILPGAPDVDAWRDACRAGRPAFRPIPSERWPVPDAAEHPACRVGGFVDDPPFDPTGLDLDGVPITKLDPMFRWVLATTRDALAGVRRGGRTDLLLANLSLPSSGAVRSIAGPYLASAAAVGLSVPLLANGEPLDRHHSDLPATIAARALGLRGQVTALDAACASGLYAVRLACDRLSAGLCDTAVTAAVNHADTAYLFLGFTQLKALSPSGASRPLDRRGDGLLVGEGAAAVALKRLDDAVRDGDVIHAVIRGGGLGNDGRKGNLLAPSGAGQLRTLRAAWEQAGIAPSAVGYVECHATGTPVGDRTEIEALTALLGGTSTAPVVLSSAKALIGHTVTCAGLAALLRAVFAVRDGFFPPIPCDEPMVDGRTFRVATAPEEWTAAERLAGVSAFGFGGTNAHLVVSRYTEAPARTVARSAPDEDLAIVAIAARLGDRSGAARVSDAWIDGVSTLADAPVEVSRGLSAPRGTYVGSVRVDGARWRIPPVELAEMLPQHLLLLDVAADAVAEAGCDVTRTASIVGMSLDHQISEAVIRWHVGAAAAAGGLDPVAWMQAIGPSLTASRVQGALPNFVANRLAALLDLQGPSYTVSSGPRSGIVALRHAARLLATGEVDAAVVAAVDLPGQIGASSVDGIAPAEACVAVVVKRLRDVGPGEVVHAIVRADEAGSMDRVVAPDRVDRLGDAGAARGLLDVLGAIGCVRDGLVPATESSAARPWLDGRRAMRVVVDDRFGAHDAVVIANAAASVRPALVGAGVLVLRAAAAPELRARVEDALAIVVNGGDDGHLRACAIAPGEGPLALGAVALDASTLADQLRAASHALARGDERFVDPRGTWVRRAVGGRVAFVFPGAGSAYVGMGRGLWRGFPRSVERLAGSVRDLAAQTFAAEVFPADESGPDTLRDEAVRSIWSSAWHAILAAHVVRDELGVAPDDALGYSLGESAALVALGAWPDADLLFERICGSPLFRTELAGPMNAVREAWAAEGIASPEDQPFGACIVREPRDVAARIAASVPGASVVLVNTDDECVIGGPREALEAALAQAGVERRAGPFAACVHAPVVGAVRAAYEALHRVPTRAIGGVRFWSSLDAAPFVPDEASAAANIASQACVAVDWPRLVRAAWDDGVRVFVEVGPRGSCTRWTSDALGDRDHVAIATDRSGRDARVSMLHAAAELLACGVSVDRTTLCDRPAPRAERPITVPHSGPAIAWPTRAWSGAWDVADRVPSPLPRGRDEVHVVRVDGPVDAGVEPLRWFRIARAASPEVASNIPVTSAHVASSPRRPAPRPTAPAHLGVAELAAALSRASNATADAHAEFLAQQAQGLEQIAQIGLTAQRLADVASRGASSTPAGSFEQPVPMSSPVAAPTMPQGPVVVPRSFDRAALERFAAGKLSECLGPAYADLDRYEPRTRLPTEPLLLVSRVIDVAGERGTLGPSRVITEYDIPADAWWSHDGKAPPCIVVESGQADLFLVSYLGIESHCRGQRVYRLLDCDLTFHGSRPALGRTLRHDIRIKRFARLGETVLFYFEYDAIDAGDGRRVMTMRNGVAGFFTPAELAYPQGCKIPDDRAAGVQLSPVVSGAPSTLDAAAVEALAAGRYSEAMGKAFAAGDGSGLRLPPAPWRLVHRVAEMSTTGGPHGLGRIRVEQDLSDDDWFNPCHFVGDPCMPGTLMFDGCGQAASLWLLAMGFPVEYRDATFEPIPDVATKLRCRGQIAPGHRLLVYDVRVKDAGLEPAPWVLADVVLIVDGTPVVLAEDVGVRIEGRRVARAVAQPAVEIGDVVDHARVMEYSVGDPSRAFGPAFLPFDAERRIARMPGPPILTMTRVLAVEGEAGVVAADRSVSIEHDYAPDAWYFQASPGTSMPFVALLETALQPCGWLTAWQQTAIAAGGDLYFRNLDGRAILHAQVWPDTGPLVTTVKQTAVARSGGMVIHGFDIRVSAGNTLIFEGATRFGYFTASALANQKGLMPPADDEARRSALRARATGGYDLRDAEPIHGILPRSDLRMLDRIVGVVRDGGVAGLGYWVAEKDVVRADWYFTAHFHLDPVTPGSLGLEALCQMARLALAERLGRPVIAVEPIATGTEIRWKYRGQIPPTRKKSVYELEIIGFEDGDEPVLIANGLVRGDDLPIYELKNVRVRALRMVPATPAKSLPARPAPAAALLDRFERDGDRGTGVLRVDPALHSWLRDHCPTIVVPAIPMAFAAEIAAEAASLLRPGRLVIGLPIVEALKWLHTGDGPFDLLVEAVASGDRVEVSLGVFKRNERFPKLSGTVVHMRATVQMGDAWEPAPTLPALDVVPSGLDPAAYYGGGHTFHGPVLQAMTELRLGARAAGATFATRPDADLLPSGSPAFILDPLVLDTATHPMMSGQPERWIPGLAPGKIAYPVRCEGLRFHGVRPVGDVDARLILADSEPGTLAFDVVLAGADGAWCSFRWIEALVDGGPLLGRAASVRRPFCWERLPDPDVHIGRHVGGTRWRVEDADVVEPLPGSLIRLCSSAREIAAWHRSPDRDRFAVALLAAKEAVRYWLIARIGRDVHPSTVHLLAMRPDRYVVVDATALTAQEYIDHLGPTRFDLRVEDDGRGVTAWIEARES